jgi:hypothetical protein
MGNSKTNRTKRNKARRKARLQGGEATPNQFVMAGQGAMVPRLGASSQMLLGTSQSIRRTLCLYQQQQLPISASTYNEAVVSVTSAYNGGTSAGGYSKYMAFYKKCYVLGARIKIDMTQFSTPLTPDCLIVGVALEDSNVPFGSITKALQNGLQQWSLLNTNPDTKHFNLGVDVAKFYNKVDVVDDDRLFSLVTTDPTDQIYLHLFAEPVDGSTATTVVYAIETLLDVVFTDPIQFT